MSSSAPVRILERLRRRRGLIPLGATDGAWPEEGLSFAPLDRSASVSLVSLMSLFLFFWLVWMGLPCCWCPCRCPDGAPCVCVCACIRRSFAESQLTVPDPRIHASVDPCLCTFSHADRACHVSGRPELEHFAPLLPQTLKTLL